ncbi:hypothetical protein GF351_02705 [Candidatus Woesearchaeota archaeon]|nr:hypothetical protein [Candidatus Woesearchaeota archaeon]
MRHTKNLKTMATFMIVLTVMLPFCFAQANCPTGFEGWQAEALSLQRHNRHFEDLSQEQQQNIRADILSGDYDAAGVDSLGYAFRQDTGQKFRYAPELLQLDYAYSLGSAEGAYEEWLNMKGRSDAEAIAVMEQNIRDNIRSVFSQKYVELNSQGLVDDYLAAVDDQELYDAYLKLREQEFQYVERIMEKTLEEQGMSLQEVLQDLRAARQRTDAEKIDDARLSAEQARLTLNQAQEALDTISADIAQAEQALAAAESRLEQAVAAATEPYTAEKPGNAEELVKQFIGFRKGQLGETLETMQQVTIHRLSDGAFAVEIHLQKFFDDNPLVWGDDGSIVSGDYYEVYRSEGTYRVKKVSVEGGEASVQELDLSDQSQKWMFALAVKAVQEHPGTADVDKDIGIENEWIRDAEQRALQLKGDVIAMPFGTQQERENMELVNSARGELRELEQELQGLRERYVRSSQETERLRQRAWTTAQRYYKLQTGPIDDVHTIYMDQIRQGEEALESLETAQEQEEELAAEPWLAEEEAIIGAEPAAEASTEPVRELRKPLIQQDLAVEEDINQLVTPEENMQYMRAEAGITVDADGRYRGPDGRFVTGQQMQDLVHSYSIQQLGYSYDLNVGRWRDSQGRFASKEAIDQEAADYISRAGYRNALEQAGFSYDPGVGRWRDPLGRFASQQQADEAARDELTRQRIRKDLGYSYDPGVGRWRDSQGRFMSDDDVKRQVQETRDARKAMGITYNLVNRRIQQRQKLAEDEPGIWISREDARKETDELIADREALGITPEVDQQGDVIYRDNEGNTLTPDEAVQRGREAVNNLRSQNIIGQVDRRGRRQYTRPDGRLMPHEAAEKAAREEAVLAQEPAAEQERGRRRNWLALLLLLGGITGGLLLWRLRTGGPGEAARPPPAAPFSENEIASVPVPLAQEFIDDYEYGLIPPENAVTAIQNLINWESYVQEIEASQYLDEQGEEEIKDKLKKGELEGRFMSEVLLQDCTAHGGTCLDECEDTEEMPFTEAEYSCDRYQKCCVMDIAEKEKEEVVPDCEWSEEDEARWEEEMAQCTSMTGCYVIDELDEGLAVINGSAPWMDDGGFDYEGHDYYTSKAKGYGRVSDQRATYFFGRIAEFEPGEYLVCASYDGTYNRPSCCVNYWIHHAGQKTRVTAGQANCARFTWKPLGTFYFDGREEEKVVIDPSQAHPYGATNADAVMLCPAAG